MSNKSKHSDPDPESLPHEVEPQGEELVHVPKGRGRFQYLFMVFLLIFMTVIFVVGDALRGACSGKRGGSESMRWRHPTEGELQVSASEFLGLKERLADLTNRNSIEDFDVASFIIQDRLALDAGIVISDAELAEQLQQFVDRYFGGAEQYKQRMQNFRGGVPGFEDTLRRSMRVQRYLELLGTLAAQADPRDVEQLWAADHVELAFDYVELPTAELEGEARLSLPGEAELQTWFEARPADEKAAFNTPERLRAESIGWVDGLTSDASALLAKYPAPEGSDLEAQAHRYYDDLFFLRFRRPEPLPAPSDPGNAPEDAQKRFYFSFEEVEARVRAEAPVRSALLALLSDLSARAASGELVDFSAEALALGLAHFPPDLARSSAEWGQAAPQGGSTFASNLSSLPVGELGSQLIVDEDALLITRLVERQASGLPPFPEIAARVGDAWVKQRAQQLALERLNSLRESLRPMPADGSTPDLSAPVVADPVIFAQRAQAAGFAVGRRDWLDKSGPQSDDPSSSEPAHQFFRERADYLVLEPGDVPVAALARSKERAYLVRLEGQRPVGFERMNPSQLSSYMRRAASLTAESFGKGSFGDPAVMRSRWGLWLWNDEDQPGAQP